MNKKNILLKKYVKKELEKASLIKRCMNSGIPLPQEIDLKQLKEVLKPKEQTRRKDRDISFIPKVALEKNALRSSFITHSIKSDEKEL